MIQRLWCIRMVYRREASERVRLSEMVKLGANAPHGRSFLRHHKGVELLYGGDKPSFPGCQHVVAQVAPQSNSEHLTQNQGGS